MKILINRLLAESSTDEAKKYTTADEYVRSKFKIEKSGMKVLLEQLLKEDTESKLSSMVIPESKLIELAKQALSIGYDEESFIEEVYDVLGIFKSAGTMNQYYINNPYLKHGFDDDNSDREIERALKWEITQVLRGKPAYLNFNPIYPISEDYVKSFANSNNLFYKLTPSGGVISKSKDNVMKVVSALRIGDDRALGLALGYNDISGHVPSENKLREIFRRVKLSESKLNEQPLEELVNEDWKKTLGTAAVAASLVGGVPQVDAATHQKAGARIHSVDTPKNISQKNNNPVNIRDEANTVKWQGKVGIDHKGFVRFSDLTHGFRAGVVNFKTNQRHSPNMSIEKYLLKFANTSPHNEKINYIAHVANGLGVDKHTPISKLDPFKVVKLQAEVESGRTLAFTPELMSQVRKLI